MTSSRRYSVIGRALAVLAIVAAGSFVACNNSQGDTDGGQATDGLGYGDQPVSDGGFGARLSLSVDGVPSSQAPTLQVGEITEFTVFAQDPRGQGLDYQRVFCDSEKGIAIIEPSRGGVAFEHTNRNGYMSGKVACIHAGSFIIECRLEEGFNLVDRQSVRCVGDGAAFFPLAAGGNLGGGSLVPVEGGASGATGSTGATGAITQ